MSRSPKESASSRLEARPTERVEPRRASIATIVRVQASRTSRNPSLYRPTSSAPMKLAQLRASHCRSRRVSQAVRYLRFAPRYQARSPTDPPTRQMAAIDRSRSEGVRSLRGTTTTPCPSSAAAPSGAAARFPATVPVRLSASGISSIVAITCR